MTIFMKVQAGGASLDALELTAVEGLHRLYRFELRVRSSAGGPSPSALVNTTAQVLLNDGLGNSRTLGGLVTQARNEIFDDESATLLLTLQPAAYLLTLGRNCRVFLDSDVTEIAAKVLAGVPHRLELTRSYAKRPYCAQYREDDWQFLCRLLEEEGIYYWFDHAAGSQLVLADDSTFAADLPGGALIAVQHQATMQRSQEVIEALGGRAQVGPEAFVVKSFDPEHPELVVEGSAGGGRLEQYDAPGGGPLTSAECSRQSGLKSGAAAAATGGVSGSTNSVRMTPGCMVQPSGDMAGGDGRYLITTVRTHVTQPHSGQRSASYSCAFEAIAAGTPFVPPRRTPLAQQAGLQSGVVGGPGGEEIYPDERGRVRVQLHWDREGGRDDKSGTWMRVAQRGTASSMQLPRVGWNVMTFNDEGAVDAPSVLSRLVDGEHPPPYALPANQTRVVFKTATTPMDGSFNEIHFEDVKGRELMHINASRDMNTLVRNDRGERVARDGRHEVGGDHSLLVGADSLTQVGSNQRVVVHGDEDEGVGGDSVTMVGGNATLTIARDRDIKVGGSHTIKVAGRRDLKVGTAVIDACIGSISGSSKMVTALIGGAQLKAAYKGIAETSNGVSLQTIGGAKLELIKKGRALKAKTYFETVAGAVLLKAGANFSDVAKTSAAWKVGGLVTTKAIDLVITATEKVEIKCGSSSLVVTKDGVELKAAELDLSNAELLPAESPRIEHN